MQVFVLDIKFEFKVVNFHSSHTVYSLAFKRTQNVGKFAQLQYTFKLLSENCRIIFCLDATENSLIIMFVLRVL